MYEDMTSGMSYEAISKVKEYGYKNARSVRSVFQSRVFPYVKSLEKS